MASQAHNGDPGAGDADSRRTLWRAVRRMFGSADGDQALRAQL